jgi:hypothetical protein
VSVCEENRRQMLGTVKSVIPAVQSNNPWSLNIQDEYVAAFLMTILSENTWK